MITTATAAVVEVTTKPAEGTDNNQLKQGWQHDGDGDGDCNGNVDG